MLVVGGLPMKWIAAAGGIAAAGVAAIMLVPSLHERAMERITIWKNPASDPLGTGYRILQSLYAIGSGGLMGSGIGNSRQKYLFLPEPQNDYVFSVVCEELGFIGALVVIVLFALLTWRGFTIVIKARDRFGAMLVTGFIAQVGVQAILIWRSSPIPFPPPASACRSFPTAARRWPFCWEKWASCFQSPAKRQ